MKKLSAFFALFAAVLGASPEALACFQCRPPVAVNVGVAVAPAPRPVPVPAPAPMPAPCGGVGCGPGFVTGPGYGAYRAFGTHGVVPGAFGVPRDAWFGPVGRYPKLFFRAPIRRALGLPGFTPVRQFLFGRGAIRRQTRRAFLFGRGGCC